MQRPLQMNDTFDDLLDIYETLAESPQRKAIVNRRKESLSDKSIPKLTSSSAEKPSRGELFAPSHLGKSAMERKSWIDLDSDEEEEGTKIGSSRSSLSSSRSSLQQRLSDNFSNFRRKLKGDR